MWLKLWRKVLDLWLELVNREKLRRPLNCFGCEKYGPGELRVGAELLAEPHQNQRPNDVVPLNLHCDPCSRVVARTTSDGAERSLDQFFQEAARFRGRPVVGFSLALRLTSSMS